MARETALEMIIRMRDEASDELKKLQRELEETADDADDLGRRGGGAMRRMGEIAGGILGAGIFEGIADGIGGIGSAMIGGNAEFEQFNTRFEVLLGSAGAAQDRMEELAEFGANTPFELPGVVRADTIIQGFGLHSEEAAKRFGFSGEQIRTIAGDVASGTGAEFEEMALLIGKFSAGATGEAIARMMELGITSRAELESLGLAFSKSGELLSPLPESMETVLTLMQDKYGGLMEAQSSTFSGMMSNAQDFMGGLARQFGEPIFDRLKVGLESALEFLNKPSTQASIKAMAEGLAQLVDTLFAVGGVILDNAEPALIALGAASMVYAVTQLPAMIAAVGAASAALYAKAAALTASLGPLAAVAVAVFAVSKAWDEYNDKIDSATDKLLESRKWWVDSGEALEQYAQQGEGVKQILKEQADGLAALREEQRAEIESLAMRRNMGALTEGQYEAEMAAINARAQAIREGDADLRESLNLYSDQHIAAMGAAEDARLMRDATGELGGQVSITAEEMKTLSEELTKVMAAGGDALGDLVETNVAYMDGFEQRRAEHEARITELANAGKADQVLAEQSKYLEIEQAQAISYANQAAVQRAALGEQLIAYVTNQREMGLITKAEAEEITNALIHHYGVRADSSAVQYAVMTGHISEYNGSVDGLITKLEETEQVTADTLARRGELEAEYSAELLRQLDAGIISNEEYAQSLRNIPARVDTELTLTRYVQDAIARGDAAKVGNVGDGTEDHYYPARAGGGPMLAGQPYQVFDTPRAELMVTGQNAYMLNPDQTISALAAMSGAARPPVNITMQIGSVDSEARAQQVAEMVRQVIREELNSQVGEILNTGVWEAS